MESPALSITEKKSNQFTFIHKKISCIMQSKKSKTTAILLCFFLGNLGAHKFYLGQTGMGILFLFTLGFMGIGTLVNFIQLLLKSDADFDARYNQAAVTA